MGADADKDIDKLVDQWAGRRPQPVPEVRSAPPPVAPLKRIAPPRPSEDGVDLASMPGPWFHVLALRAAGAWLFDHRLGIALVACLPAWVGTFESDVPWATLHVAALGVAIGLSSYIALRRVRRLQQARWVWAPCALLGLLASIWYGAFLTIDDRWATGLDAKTGERVQTEDWQHAFGKDSATIFSDTRRVFGRQLIHRDMTHFDEKGHLDWEAGGPMSESGKPHGHWTTTLWEPRLNWTDQWYWYGEEVSEGQWHLRNRD